MKSWKNNLDNEFQNTGARLDLFSRKKKRKTTNIIKFLVCLLNHFQKKKRRTEDDAHFYLQDWLYLGIKWMDNKSKSEMVWYRNRENIICSISLVN
jgi:hypothetical protein